jgi:thioredoxin-dependent peroxiredoxin
MNLAIQTGAIASNFSLNNAQGQSISLKDYLGQWVVLYFYPRDNTPGCTKEACGFRDRHEAFQAQNIQVLGISADDEKSHQKFITKNNLPFTLLCDPDGTVSKIYESYGPKQFMGKTYEGVYRRTFLIDPTGKILKIYLKVKPELHAEEILRDIKDLLT